MIKQIKKPITFIFIFLLALGLSVSLQSILAAWVAPSATPPVNNVNPPINESSTNQAKLGGLSLGGALSVSGNVGFLGNLGVGGVANPNLRLDVAGGSYLHDGNNAGVIYFPNSGGTLPNFYIRSVDPNDIFTFENRLFINGADGKVGIGTTSPSEKLDVAGNIHASGDICTDAGGGKCLSDAGTGANGTLSINLADNPCSGNAACTGDQTKDDLYGDVLNWTQPNTWSGLGCTNYKANYEPTMTDTCDSNINVRGWINCGVDDILTCLQTWEYWDGSRHHCDRQTITCRKGLISVQGP